MPGCIGYSEVLTGFFSGHCCYPSNLAYPPRWSPYHGDGHPLCLQLSVPAAGDGEGDQQDQGRDDEEQDCWIDRNL